MSRSSKGPIFRGPAALDRYPERRKPDPNRLESARTYARIPVAATRPVYANRAPP